MDIHFKDAFINGAWVSTPDRFPVYNPANKELIAEVSDCGEEQAMAAIEAAAHAFPLWAGKLAHERSAILLKWKQLIVEHRQALAELMTREQGKPLKESLAEIGLGEGIEWSAEEAKRSYGVTVPPFKEGTQVLTYREPLGVVAAITPWNFPHSMITRKVAPALAAGCTVVLKPAQDTPLSALALAALAKEAGLPDGVFNIVTASQKKTEVVGKILMTHPQVAKISFTGSTAVGRALMAQAASTIKKVSLELGGNAPFIVFDSASIEDAVSGAIACKFRNAGQTCICANRIFVQSGIYDRFVKAFTLEVEKLKTGNGMQKDVNIGPLINDAGLQKVDKLVKDAENKGAELVTGGRVDTAGLLFYQPTVLTNMTDDMAMFEQEIFGPVAALYKFDTEEEAVARANDTIYGLAAYFYTKDLGQSFRVGRGLAYGMIAVNEPFLTAASIPFGGFKQSGLGREGGPHSLQEFMENKYILMGGLKN